MMTKLILFFMAVTALPAVGQINTHTAMDRLGRGTAQVVLAVVVIGLAIALVRIFLLYRRDMRDEDKLLREYMERAAKRSEDLVAKNTSAMSAQAQSNKELKEALYHLSNNIAAVSGKSQA